jgi:5-methylcytosine-specific restriction endonuclease McrBC regulatory subunit McrC
VLRLGLVRDYEVFRREEPSVRGRVALFPTATLYYAGRLAFDCEYDEFTFNTPLNRMIRAAAQAVVAAPMLAQETRSRGIRVAARVEDADDLRAGDLGVEVDRRSAHYREPILLARAAATAPRSDAFSWRQHRLDLPNPYA